MLLDAAPPPPSPAALPFSPEVEVVTDLVRLSALADLSALPAALSRDVAELPVLRIPKDRDVVVVDADQLRARVAALAPELKPWLAGRNDGAIRIHYQRPALAAAREDACLKVVGPAAADTVVGFREVADAPCTESVVDGLWFDRTQGVMRARRDLKPGEILHAPPASALATVAPGDPMVLEVSVGPVKVQRRVEAVQAARPGQGLFARTADGAVISIPAPMATP